jgi:hypothetical protein
MSAMRVFEQDAITICDVYSALKMPKCHLTHQEDRLKIDITEYLDSWRPIADFVQQRQRNLLDTDLVKVAFWLTSFGCIGLAREEEFIPEDHRPHLQYELPPKTLARGPSEAMTAEAPPWPGGGPELDEGNRADYEHTGNVIKDESITRAPRLQVTRRQTLIFIRELLVRFLLEHFLPSQPAGDETSEPNDMDGSIRSCMEGLIRRIFGSDRYVSRCQHT